MDNATPTGQFIFYTAPDGAVKIEVFFQAETVWLTQKKLAELFGVDLRTVNEHLGNIFTSGELNEETTLRKFRMVQSEGGRKVERELNFYNLDAIIAVGYRVNSFQATQFRIWATSILKEYLIKGFAMDDERLKRGSQLFGKDYFEELLERIREIRASERRFYQKITDIYATSVDYNKDALISQQFFKTVQNKLHWAITGHTAAEIIAARADSTQPHMGLTNWRAGASGKILKSDTAIAKNYLNPTELADLNRIVGMYLDYAEMQAQRGQPMRMEDWVKRLDAFLVFNERAVLTNPGKVSAATAKAFAEKEFEKFRVEQDRNYVSDFDRAIARYLQAEVSNGSE